MMISFIQGPTNCSNCSTGRWVKTSIDQGFECVLSCTDGNYTKGSQGTLLVWLQYEHGIYYALYEDNLKHTFKVIEYLRLLGYQSNHCYQVHTQKWSGLVSSPYFCPLQSKGPYFLSYINTKKLHVTALLLPRSTIIVY